MENLDSTFINGAIINLKTAEIKELENNLSKVKDDKEKQKNDLNAFIVKMSNLGEN